MPSTVSCARSWLTRYCSTSLASATRPVCEERIAASLQCECARKAAGMPPLKTANYEALPHLNKSKYVHLVCEGKRQHPKLYASLRADIFVHLDHDLAHLASGSCRRRSLDANVMFVHQPEEDAPVLLRCTSGL